MSQPVYHVVKYKGAIEVKAGVKLNGSDVTGGNVLIMKTKDVRGSVNGSVAFPINFNEMSYLDTNAYYTFDRDCIIAVCEVVEAQ